MIFSATGPGISEKKYRIRVWKQAISAIINKTIKMYFFEKGGDLFQLNIHSRRMKLCNIIFRQPATV